MIAVLLTIALAGFLCWLILKIPMPPVVQNVIVGVFVVLVIVFVLQRFGVDTGLPRLRL